jgi:phosphatidylglycerophosphate synthase
MQMPGPENRRPLRSRQSGWAQALSRRLADGPITPNQISIASMACAALAGLAFLGAGQSDGALRVALLLLAALGCQARLVCNLLDGMVAVEGGKQSPDGAFWNEFPDRVSDMLILCGVGYGFGLPELGWAAAGLAILTAYVRELGRASGQPADYAGPMAKPQRMAVLTGAALLSVIESVWAGQGGVMRIALWVVALGAAATVLRRSWRLLQRLRRRA